MSEYYCQKYEFYLIGSCFHFNLQMEFINNSMVCTLSYFCNWAKNCLSSLIHMKTYLFPSYFCVNCNNMDNTIVNHLNGKTFCIPTECSYQHHPVAVHTRIDIIGRQFNIGQGGVTILPFIPLPQKVEKSRHKKIG